MTLGDAGLFGVSGSPFTPMHTPYEIPEDEIARRAEEGWKNVAASRWKIFIPHAPPRDTKVDRIALGKHVGSTAVRSFIEQHQPDIVVCGHIHEARGIDTIGRTQIVNCGPAGRGYYAVIHLGEQVSIEVRG
jgi:Icc-related predicted phosphoesterase